MTADMPTWQILEGDCRDTLAKLTNESVQTVITSPPYFGLRDYGHADQIGVEPTPDEFVAALVEVFRGVRRVLREDGTVWLNIGDSYWTAKGNPGKGSVDEKLPARRGWSRPQDKPSDIFKPKDLIGIPWMVAFALRADGWFLRCDVIWEKPNTLPEPTARDRPHRNHEYLFLLSKSRRYFYDEDAIREESDPEQEAHNQKYAKVYDAQVERSTSSGVPGNQNNHGIHSRPGKGGRPKRSVWKVSTVPFNGPHSAAFPPKLVEPCILAATREGDTVLDPFAGSGTTGMVALRHGRAFIGCELNPLYVQTARQRITDDAPLLNTYAEVA